MSNNNSFLSSFPKHTYSLELNYPSYLRSIIRSDPQFSPLPMFYHYHSQAKTITFLEKKRQKVLSPYVIAKTSIPKQAVYWNWSTANEKTMRRVAAIQNRGHQDTPYLFYHQIQRDWWSFPCGYWRNDQLQRQLKWIARGLQGLMLFSPPRSMPYLRICDLSLRIDCRNCLKGRLFRNESEAVVWPFHRGKEYIAQALFLISCRNIGSYATLPIFLWSARTDLIHSFEVE